MPVLIQSPPKKIVDVQNVKTISDVNQKDTECAS